MEFNFKEFTSKKVAVVWDTIEEKQEFVKLLVNHGVKWNSGELVEENDSKVRNAEEFVFTDSRGLTYSSSAGYCKNTGKFTMVNVKEILRQPKKEETKQMTEKEKAIQAKRERGKKIKAIQESFGIEKLIVNGETLVVFFKDGTKFVETAVGGDEFSVRTGIALAIAHHNAGSKMLYHEAVDKMCNKLQVF